MLRKDKNWCLRKSDDGDVPKIIGLMEAAFNGEIISENLDSEHWMWKYDQNPLDQAGSFVADDDGIIVGHYGCIPFEISTPESEVKACIVVDVMTHPNYRMQGIFTSLGSFSLTTMEKQNYHLSIGFTPSSRASSVLPGHLKIGWVELKKIPILGKPIDLREVAAGRFTNRVLRFLGRIGLRAALSTVFRWKMTKITHDLTIRETDITPNEFDSLWKKFGLDYNLIQKRNYEFLKWRFLTSPFRTYRIIGAYSNETLLGYSVVRSFQLNNLAGTLIIDLFSRKDDEETIGALLDWIYEDSKQNDTDIIAILSSDKTIRTQLRNKGFLKTGESYSFIIRTSQHIKSERHLYLNYDDWFITWADLDIL